MFGLGCSACVTAAGPGEVAGLLRQLESSGSVRWLGKNPELELGIWTGGIAFEPERAGKGIWSGFPAARFVVPEVLCHSSARRSLLCAIAPGASSASETQRRLQRRLDQAQERLAQAIEPVPSESGQTPLSPAQGASERRAWDRLISKALADIAAGSLQKVVVARAIRLRVARGFDFLRALETLRQVHPAAYVFLITADDGSRFLGASPELLLGLRNRDLRTEAVAGTVSASAPDDELFNAKTLEEHDRVVQGLGEALAPFSESISRAGSPRPLVLPGLKHLRTPFEVVLREGVSLSELVGALHPTPATGGTPRAAALEFLREHEGWPRGWYAGAVGCVGPGQADLAVGIRSALLRDGEGWVFVGAGIVAGSSAESEWSETELKSRTMLEALASVTRDPASA
jgi:salicylate biosynthesis isochorismate synthase